MGVAPRAKNGEKSNSKKVRVDRARIPSDNEAGKFPRCLAFVEIKNRPRTAFIGRAMGIDPTTISPRFPPQYPAPLCTIPGLSPGNTLTVASWSTEVDDNSASKTSNNWDPLHINRLKPKSEISGVGNSANFLHEGPGSKRLTSVSDAKARAPGNIFRRVEVSLAATSTSRKS